MPTAYGEPGRSGHYGAPRPYCHIGLLLYTTWVFTHHCRSNPVDNSKTEGKYAQPDLRKRELRARVSFLGHTRSEHETTQEIEYSYSRCAHLYSVMRLG